MQNVISLPAYTEHAKLAEKYQQAVALNNLHHDRNAALLHAIYFRCIEVPTPVPVGGALEIALNNGIIGGVENLVSDLITIANGPTDVKWAILSLDILTRQLVLDQTTDHDSFGVAAIPVMAFDLYEHAYWMDYGTNRAAYAEAFVAGLNWAEVDRRLTSAQKISSGVVL